MGDHIKNIKIIVIPEEMRQRKGQTVYLKKIKADSLNTDLGNQVMKVKDYPLY